MNSQKPSPEKKNLPTSETLLVLCKALRRFIDKKVKGRYISPNLAQIPKKLRSKNSPSKKWKYYFENENTTMEDKIHDVLKDNIFLEILQGMNNELEKVVNYLENNKKNIECLDNNVEDKEMKINLFNNLRQQLNNYFDLNESTIITGNNDININKSLQIFNDKNVMDSIQKLNILQNKNDDNNKENKISDEKKEKKVINFENGNKESIDSDLEDFNNFLGCTEYNNKNENSNNNIINQFLNKKVNRDENNNKNDEEENGIEKHNQNQSTPSKQTVNSTESNNSKKKIKKKSKKNDDENLLKNNIDENNNITNKENNISLNETEINGNKIINDTNICVEDSKININSNNPREASFETFLNNYFKKQSNNLTEKKLLISDLISKINNKENFSFSLKNKEINGPFLVGSYKHIPNQLELINYYPNIDILFSYSKQKLEINDMNILVKETLTENLKLTILNSEIINEKTNTIKISNKCTSNNIEIYIDIFFVDISKNNYNNEKIVNDLIFKNKLYNEENSHFNILMLFFRKWRRKYKLFNVIPEFIDEIIYYVLEEHRNKSLSIIILNIFASLYKGVEDFFEKKNKGLITSNNKNIIEKLMNVIYCNIKNKDSIQKAVISATDFIKGNKVSNLFEEVNNDD